MRSARMVLAVAGTAMLVLSACSRSDEVPNLMNIRSSTQGPDEFAILPPKPLQMPEDIAALPEPTPGGTNRTDPTPNADAVAALGGTLRPAGGLPASDGALYAHAARYGVTGGIRETLAAEDLEFRRRNDGRLLERIFNVNVYYRAYQDQSLDQQAELWRWRNAGARTPSAPPPQDGETR
ncbi:MAG: hypothetical protein RIR62_1830 [Pseudomonadota bacterium]